MAFMMSGNTDAGAAKLAKPAVSRRSMSQLGFSGLAIINALAFYSYLFWDSLQTASPALAGARVDPLFMRGDRFMDWVNTLHSAALTTAYGMTNQVAMPVYGPLTYVVLAPFSRSLISIKNHATLALLAWVGITCVVTICLVINLHRARVAMESDHVIGSLMLPILVAYPFLFAFDRGNLELITLCLVSWYVKRTIVSLRSKGQAYPRNRVVSNLILALAVSIKPYTLLFVALLLVGRRRTDFSQLKQCLISLIEVVIMALSMAITSLLILYRGHLLRGLSDFLFWQHQFKLDYVIGGSGDRFYCSPYVLGKKLLNIYGASDLIMNAYYRLYPLLGLAVLACLLLTAWRFVRRNPHPSVILAVISFGLLLVPFNANEYKAVYFLIPFTLGFTANGSTSIDSVSTNNKASGIFGLTPITATRGLSFIMLVNRYGLLGDNELASLLTSLLLSLFPVLLLCSFRRTQSALSTA